MRCRLYFYDRSARPSRFVKSGFRAFWSGERATQTALNLSVAIAPRFAPLAPIDNGGAIAKTCAHTKLLCARRAFFALSALCALGGALGVAGCGGSNGLPATSANPAGRIAFAQFGPTSQSRNVSRTDIYLINADGSGLKRLTPEVAGADNFSPRSRPLASASPLFRRATRPPIFAPCHQRCRARKFAQLDARYLVYSGNSFDPSPGASTSGRNSRFHFVRTDGSGERQLLAPVDANAVQFCPSWSR